MLTKLRKFLKNKERVIDTLNAILGLLMLAALVIYAITGKKFGMYLMIFSGGCMNLVNGYKTSQIYEKRNMGHSMMMFGVVILVMGIVIMMI